MKGFVSPDNQELSGSDVDLGETYFRESADARFLWPLADTIVCHAHDVNLEIENVVHAIR